MLESSELESSRGSAVLLVPGIVHWSGLTFLPSLGIVITLLLLVLFTGLDWRVTYSCAYFRSGGICVPAVLAVKIGGFDLEFLSFWVSRSFDLSDLGDLRRGSVNFFKNYIFEISASS